ncbi:phosphoribosyltransferase [Devosia sp. D6-9]|nr:phosphoribosyltransferase [Devosia sp. D6-9]
MAGGGHPFRDRRDAGRRLAAALMRFKSADLIVLALPRGGVPVGHEVAAALGAPLDVLIVRKIGAPGHEELGLGALVEGDPPQIVLNDEVMAAISPSGAHLETERMRQLGEMNRRRKLYRGDRALPPLAGRTVILVDDGIATGGTVRAALRGLEASGAKTVVLAVPVAPADVLATLRPLAGAVVCLETPYPFNSVGEHYQEFPQTSDEEVIALLAEHGGAGEAAS